MKPKPKGTSLAAALMVIALIISIFSLGFYSEGQTGDKISGNVVKVSGALSQVGVDTTGGSGGVSTQVGGGQAAGDKKYTFITAKDGRTFVVEGDQTQAKKEVDDYTIKEQNKIKIDATYQEIKQPQYTAATKASKDSSLSYNNGDLVITTSKDSGGRTTTTTEIYGEGGFTSSTEKREGGGLTLTIERDKDKNIESVTDGTNQLGPSIEWNIVKNNEGVWELTYGGRPGEWEDNRFKFSDDTGGFVSVLEDGSTISGDKDGYVVIEDKDGKTVASLKEEEYENLVGQNPTIDQLNTLGKVASSLREAGLDLSAASHKDNKYYSNDVVVEVSGTNIITTQCDGCVDNNGEIKTDKGYAYESVTRDANDNVVKLETNAEKEEGKFETTTVEWSVNGEGKQVMTIEDDNGNFDEFILQDDKVYYYSEDDNKYYNRDNGAWYKKDTNGDLVPCGDDCKNLDDLGNKIGEADDKKESLEGRKTRFERNIDNIWSALEDAASGGAGRFFSLFMDDEDLAKWREDVDEFLCDTILAGGKDCWTSEVCKIYVDIEADSAAYVETNGLLAMVAHIEGERSDAISYVNVTNATTGSTESVTQYFYKITANVENPADSDTSLKFNLYVKKSDGSLKAIFNSDVELKEGESFAKYGSSSIVKYSETLYDGVCIIFSSGFDDIITGSGSENELCNLITLTDMGVSSYGEEGASTGGTGGSGTDEGWSDW